MHGVSSKIVYTLLVLLCFLMFPVQQLDAQPMWGEEGIFPILLQNEIRIHEIKLLSNGNQSVTIMTDRYVPGPTRDILLEIELDSSLAIVDSLRYPAVCYWRGFCNSVELEDGGRIMGFETSSNYPMVARIDSLGEPVWVYESDFVGYVGWGYSTAQLYRIQDYAFFVHQQNGGILQFEWIDLATGEGEQNVQVSDNAVTSFAVRYQDDGTTRVVTSWSGEESYHCEEYVTAPGDTVLETHTLIEYELESNYVIACKYLEDNTFFYMYLYPELTEYYALLFDNDGNMVDSLALETGHKIVKNSINGSNFYSASMDGFSRYSILNDSIYCDYTVDEMSFLHCTVVNIPNGGILVQDYENYELYYVDENGQLLWGGDEEVIASVDINSGFNTGDEYIVMVDSNCALNAYVYSLVDGNLIDSRGHLLNHRASQLLDAWVAAPINSTAYLAWFQKSRPENIDSLHVVKIDDDGAIVPDLSYVIRRNSFQLHHLAPTTGGGLWLIGNDRQIVLNSNLEEVVNQESAGIERTILYFDPATTTAPYPLLRLINAGPARVDLYYLSDNGDCTHDPQTLLTHPNMRHYDFEFFRNDSLLYYATLYGNAPFYIDAGVINLATGTRSDIILDAIGYPLAITEEDSVVHLIYASYDTTNQERYYGTNIVHLENDLRSGTVSEDTLVEHVIGNRGMYYHPSYGINKVMAKVVISADRAFLLCESIDDEQWRIYSCDMSNNEVSEPCLLQNIAHLDSCQLIAGTDSTIWVVGTNCVYALNRELDIAEGYNEGIPFSSYANVTYTDFKITQTIDNDLIVSGQENDYCYHMQRYSATFAENSIHTTSLNPYTFTVSAPWPNPFNSTTRLRYSLPHAGEVRLAVYDILGREVRVLANATQQAGQYEVHWDGCSDAGIGVASGVYFVRAELGEQQLVRKVLLVK